MYRLNIQLSVQSYVRVVVGVQRCVLLEHVMLIEEASFRCMRRSALVAVLVLVCVRNLLLLLFPTIFDAYALVY